MYAAELFSIRFSCSVGPSERWPNVLVSPQANTQQAVQETKHIALATDLLDHTPPVQQAARTCCFRTPFHGLLLVLLLTASAGAGNGLWATRRYEKHELITEYQGKHIDHEKALKLRKRGRHTHVRVLNSMHLYIDGLKQPEAGRGGASFANDARDPDLTNAMFIQK